MINYIIGLTLTATHSHTCLRKQYMVYHCNEMVVSVQIGRMSDQLGHCQDIFKLIINPGQGGGMGRSEDKGDGEG